MRLHLLLLTVFTLMALPVLHAELAGEEALLKKGGPDAAKLINKARDILYNTQVFASRGVGEGGTPTDACWALTTLVRYDREAKSFLNDLFEQAEFPEQRLYGMAGLIALDPKEKSRFTEEKLKQFAEERVCSQFGCVGEASTFGIQRYLLLQDGYTGYYLFKELPSLYSTTTVSRPKESAK
ncbi:hypothetical protein [Prosthecobacter sp.]|uniref:hypothetical protein n=1 Tax=Prosthecobacter sp. TaxID=1965333 RepID=UPI0037847805